MKDYLLTFDEDITRDVTGTRANGLSIIRIKVTHKPTGIYYETPVPSILPDRELCLIAERALKEKLKAHYEKEELKRIAKEDGCEYGGCDSCVDIILREKESERFIARLKDNVNSDGDLKKETGIPQNPAGVVYDLLISAGYKGTISLDISRVVDDMEITEELLSMLISGTIRIKHVLAYKLAKVIEGTDVRFWMDLQERYDGYKGESK